MLSGKTPIKTSTDQFLILLKYDQSQPYFYWLQLTPYCLCRLFVRLWRKLSIVSRGNSWKNREKLTLWRKPWRRGRTTSASWQRKSGCKDVSFAQLQKSSCVICTHRHCQQRCYIYYKLYISNLHFLSHRSLSLSSESFERLCEPPATVATDTHREGDTDVTEEVDDGRGFSIGKQPSCPSRCTLY